jgi:alkylation response protein AidB-like acyl-CoA dehydrogenase
MEQIVANEELARAGAPPLIGEVGLEVVGPTIVAEGTPEQKAAYLERILSGDDIWCQGFSEPNAGSDLASLRTRAEDRGDHFVINGQKTWTSWAQYASWCAVLARTDPDAPPHRGISYLIVDMRSPGIDVRPLVQMTGDAEFSEVYFQDVVVPRENVLGKLNAGWALAMHTLTNERGPVVLSHQVKLRVALDALAADATRFERDGVPAIDDPQVRASLARAHVAVEVLRYHAYRSVGGAIARGAAGVETSVDKLQMTAADKVLGDACLDVLGPFAASPEGAPHGTSAHAWQHLYLHSRASRSTAARRRSRRASSPSASSDFRGAADGPRAHRGAAGAPLAGVRAPRAARSAGGTTGVSRRDAARRPTLGRAGRARLVRRRARG